MNEDPPSSNAGADSASGRPRTHFDAPLLTPHMALEQLLQLSTSSSSADLAAALLGKFDTLSNVLKAGNEQLLAFDGMTPNSVKLLRVVGWIIFVVDEFRSWQDRHSAGTPAYAEDEEVLETLAFVLPTQHLNIITIIASQGDMPQKLSGGGEGDRFLPLYLLADKNKGDFGEIVTFRCRELFKGAATDIKDYYDYCRKEYKFIKQANISLEYFTAIFPFQPRCFDVMRRLTQNAEKHNLPTARSATGYGLLTDYMAEIFAELRRRNFQTHVNAWVDFGNMTGRNQDAIKKTAAGLLKLLYPHRSPDNLASEEIHPVMDLAVEMRQRVTDQLARILPTEFSNVEYGFTLIRQ